MRTVDEMAMAIEGGETFTEARAILDYTCQTATTAKWIVSHEILRRDLDALAKQCEALKKQNASLSNDFVKCSRELEAANQKCKNLERRLEKLTQPAGVKS